MPQALAKGLRAVATPLTRLRRLGETTPPTRCAQCTKACSHAQPVKGPRRTASCELGDISAVSTWYNLAGLQPQTFYPAPNSFQLRLIAISITHV